MQYAVLGFALCIYILFKTTTYKITTNNNKQTKTDKTTTFLYSGIYNLDGMVDGIYGPNVDKKKFFFVFFVF